MKKLGEIIKIDFNKTVKFHLLCRVSTNVFIAAICENVK